MTFLKLCGIVQENPFFARRTVIPKFALSVARWIKSAISLTLANREILKFLQIFKNDFKTDIFLAYISLALSQNTTSKTDS